MSDYAGVTNQLGNAVGLPFSSFSTDEPGMIDLAFAADDLTRMNDMFWLDGIRRDSANWNDGDGAVRWSNGFNVYVRPFRGHVNGTIVFASQTALSIEQEAVSERVDSIIIRRDYTLRTVNVMVLKGESGSANPPSLTYNTFGVVEYELARVRVTNGMAALSQDDITDMRTVLLADFLSARPTSADAGKIPMVDSQGGFGLSNAITTLSDRLAASQQVLHVQDQKPSGTVGGTFTAGTRTRGLNTVVKNTIPGASLANNQFTLPAGKYHVFARVPAFRVNYHVAQLYSVTAGENKIAGSMEYASETYGQAQIDSIIIGDIELTTTTVFEIRHWSSDTRADNGFGQSHSGTPVPHIFTDVYIRRIA